MILTTGSMLPSAALTAYRVLRMDQQQEHSTQDVNVLGDLRCHLLNSDHLNVGACVGSVPRLRCVGSRKTTF
jgi:hypothetical protein